jgi:CRP/FNR family cyclic AMP-dependent transcriptional regulator
VGERQTWYRRSFMGRLPEPARQALLALGHTALLDEGATLLRQGDPGGVAYLILDGRVNVTAVSENGTRSLLAIRHPGDLIGEMAVISDERRAATIVGRVRTTLLTLPGTGFVRFLGDHPAAALALSAITGDRLMQAHSYRTDAAAYPVEVRVARALLYQGQRMAHQADGFYYLDLRQAELAMLIGAKEGTVQKALAQGPQLRHLVENQRGRVVIRDLQGLTYLAELREREA